MTRTSLSRSKGQKVKGQGHQAALLTAALTRQAAAAVSVGTYILGVENYCYVAVCSAARGASAPTEGGEGRGHIVAAARLLLIVLITFLYFFSVFASTFPFVFVLYSVYDFIINNK